MPEPSHRRQLRSLADSLVSQEICDEHQIESLPVSKRSGMLLISRDPLIYITERKGMMTTYREPGKTLYYGDWPETVIFLKGWYAGAEQARSQ